MTKHFYKDDHAKPVKRIMEGELWELVKIVMVDVNNNRVLGGGTYCESAEYSRHALINTLHQ